MSNSLYDSARIAFGTAGINWLGDNIKAAILTPAYPGGSVSISGDSEFTAIAPYILAGTTASVTLTTKVTSVGALTGAMSSAPVTFVALTAGQIIGYIALYKDPDPTNINGIPAIGNQASSPLIALFDSGYGIGAGTNGSNIEITWDPINGIFRL
jgi:hypothetical protein